MPTHRHMVTWLKRSLHNAPIFLAQHCSTMTRAQSRDFATAFQSVYGLCYKAPPGKFAVDENGKRYDKLVYIGASSPSEVNARITTNRSTNATLAKLSALDWAVHVLFIDHNVPIGSEDLATTILRLHFLREPSTRVVGGVSAALAAPAYAFTKNIFERLSNNSALGACLRCDYQCTSVVVRIWKSCTCAQNQKVAPEVRALRDAATLPQLRRELADLESKLKAAQGEADLLKNKCSSLQSTLDGLQPCVHAARAVDLDDSQPVVDASRSPKRWAGIVSGVSLAAQTSSRSERRAFQSKLPFFPHKVYFNFKTWTQDGAAPCASEHCFKKQAGNKLLSCGKDVCVFAAACAFKCELNAAWPDGRTKENRHSRKLEEWKHKWQVRPVRRLRRKTTARF